MITNEYPTIDGYIQNMGRDTTYADHLIILATANVIKQNIVIHEVGKIPLQIPGPDGIAGQVHVLYDPLIQHYESVVCLDGNGARFLNLEHMQHT